MVANYTIAIMPWLILKDPVEVGGYRFVPYERATQNVEIDAHFRSILDEILSAYYNLTGTPRNKCVLICAPSRTPSWDIGAGEDDNIRKAVALLSLAGISSNKYYRPHDNYVNSSAFSFFYQRFTDPLKGVAIQGKRKDLRCLDGGYQHGEIKFTVPICCKSTDPVVVDGELIEGINRALKNMSLLDNRLLPALSFYNLANTDSDNMLIEAECILMGSAFEQLLDVDNKYRMSCEIGNVFKEYKSATVRDALKTRPGIKLDTQYEKEQKEWQVVRKWIEELYDLRSVFVHGEKYDSRSWGWLPVEHMIMGEFIFPLIVKILLQAERCYELTSWDKQYCCAIDRILSKLEWGKHWWASIAEAGQENRRNEFCRGLKGIIRKLGGDSK